jgi:hypothetical protein
MMSSNLKAFAKASPFTPFYVKMADGSVHTFHHPELIAVGKAAALVFAPNAEDFAVLDLRLMNEVGPIPAGADAQRTG